MSTFSLYGRLKIDDDEEDAENDEDENKDKSKDKLKDKSRGKSSSKVSDTMEEPEQTFLPADDPNSVCNIFMNNISSDEYILPLELEDTSSQVTTNKFKENVQDETKDVGHQPPGGRLTKSLNDSRYRDEIARHNYHTHCRSALENKLDKDCWESLKETRNKLVEEIQRRLDSVKNKVKLDKSEELNTCLVPNADDQDSLKRGIVTSSSSDTITDTYFDNPSLVEKTKRQLDELPKKVNSQCASMISMSSIEDKEVPINQCIDRGDCYTVLFNEASSRPSISIINKIPFKDQLVIDIEEPASNKIRKRRRTFSVLDSVVDCDSDTYCIAGLNSSKRHQRKAVSFLTALKNASREVYENCLSSSSIKNLHRFNDQHPTKKVQEMEISYPIQSAVTETSLQDIIPLTTIKTVFPHGGYMSVSELIQSKLNNYKELQYPTIEDIRVNQQTAISGHYCQTWTESKIAFVLYPRSLQPAVKSHWTVNELYENYHLSDSCMSCDHLYLSPDFRYSRDSSRLLQSPTRIFYPPFCGDYSSIDGDESDSIVGDRPPSPHYRVYQHYQVTGIEYNDGVPDTISKMYKKKNKTVTEIAKTPVTNEQALCHAVRPPCRRPSSPKNRKKRVSFTQEGQIQEDNLHLLFRRVHTMEIKYELKLGIIEYILSEELSVIDVYYDNTYPNMEKVIVPAVRTTHSSNSTLSSLVSEYTLPVTQVFVQSKNAKVIGESLKSRSPSPLNKISFNIPKDDNKKLPMSDREKHRIEMNTPGSQVCNAQNIHPRIAARRAMRRGQSMSGSSPDSLSNHPSLKGGCILSEEVRPKSPIFGIRPSNKQHESRISTDLRPKTSIKGRRLQNTKIDSFVSTDVKSKSPIREIKPQSRKNDSLLSTDSNSRPNSPKKSLSKSTDGSSEPVRPKSPLIGTRPQTKYNMSRRTKGINAPRTSRETLPPLVKEDRKFQSQVGETSKNNSGQYLTKFTKEKIGGKEGLISLLRKGPHEFIRGKKSAKTLESNQLAKLISVNSCLQNSPLKDYGFMAKERERTSGTDIELRHSGRLLHAVISSLSQTKHERLSGRHKAIGGQKSLFEQVSSKTSFTKDHSTVPDLFNRLSTMLVKELHSNHSLRSSNSNPLYVKTSSISTNYKSEVQKFKNKKTILPIDLKQFAAIGSSESRQRTFIGQDLNKRLVTKSLSMNFSPRRKRHNDENTLTNSNASECVVVSPSRAITLGKTTDSRNYLRTNRTTELLTGKSSYDKQSVDLVTATAENEKTDSVERRGSKRWPRLYKLALPKQSYLKANHVHMEASDNTNAATRLQNIIARYSEDFPKSAFRNKRCSSEISSGIRKDFIVPKTALNLSADKEEKPSSLNSLSSKDLDSTATVKEEATNDESLSCDWFEIVRKESLRKTQSDSQIAVKPDFDWQSSILLHDDNSEQSSISTQIQLKEGTQDTLTKIRMDNKKFNESFKKLCNSIDSSMQSRDKGILNVLTTFLRVRSFIDEREKQRLLKASGKDQHPTITEDSESHSEKKELEPKQNEIQSSSGELSKLVTENTSARYLTSLAVGTTPLEPVSEEQIVSNHIEEETVDIVGTTSQQKTVPSLSNIISQHLDDAIKDDIDSSEMFSDITDMSHPEMFHFSETNSELSDNVWTQKVMRELEEEEGEMFMKNLKLKASTMDVEKPETHLTIATKESSLTCSDNQLVSSCSSDRWENQDSNSQLAGNDDPILTEEIGMQDGVPTVNDRSGAWFLQDADTSSVQGSDATTMDSDILPCDSEAGDLKHQDSTISTLSFIKTLFQDINGNLNYKSFLLLSTSVLCMVFFIMNASIECPICSSNTL